MRRTKIVCTIGPASARRRVMEQMLRAGMNVARLNFSHGTHEAHAAAIALLREIAGRLGRPLALLQDLSGPKIRLGDFAPVLQVRRGQEVCFCAELPSEGATAGEATLPLPVPELLSALKPGDTLLVDDGKVTLRVVGVGTGAGRLQVRARCVTGGEIRPRKGVTAPGVAIRIPAVTEKDLCDLRFGLSQGIDWVAASYVRSAADLQPLRRVMDETGTQVPVIAKIENAEAVRNLEEILDAADGIMIARGDMGVEMDFDEVPLVQKRIIRLCNRAGKPVITATQMLESMLTNPRPTRAEASDVANAILDGTDAVMLSGETAVGHYPVPAVRTMALIARRAESVLYQDSQFQMRLPPARNVTEAVARATAEIAERVGAAAILCATTSGSTARRVAQCRPRVPILGVTTNPATYYQLALTWGVTPLLIDPVGDTDTLIERTITAAEQGGYVRVGDRVVLTAGVPVNNPGTTNLIKVHVIGQPLKSHPE
ncbi:MAG: pyruvate kinase [Chloroherpetonaceae bacterium]|nr:pyruvate kinase [Chthonomonadaceae bacterium]MDW8207072.1 pyruvate kinase [Chloroherpetonaceae bacterium]